MIKFKNKVENTIDFNSLKVGDTFMWGEDVTCMDYLGMKIKDLNGLTSILDLSDSIGTTYDNADDFFISKLVDLEVEIL